MIMIIIIMIIIIIIIIIQLSEDAFRGLQFSKLPINRPPLFIVVLYTLFGRSSRTRARGCRAKIKI